MGPGPCWGRGWAGSTGEGSVSPPPSPAEANSMVQKMLPRE